MSATVTSKGQVTIPKYVREKLKLQAGDKLDFLLQDDSTASVVPVTSSIKELRGMIPRPKKPMSLEDINRF